jgi:glycosyltransferase involved in cell wall biosynthesis
VPNFPPISVIVPVFNAAEFLECSLDSALTQSLRDIEIICVDDGSTDDSSTILAAKAASDGRVNVIHLDCNQGAGAARNVGLDNCRGQFIVMLDADDSLPPYSLEARYQAAVERGSDLVLGEYDRWIGPDCISDHGEGYRPPSVNCSFRESKYLQAIPGGHWCILYARDLLDRNRIRYDEDLSFGEDQIFQLKAMLAAERITLIDDVVYNYHHYHMDSITLKAPNLRNLLDEIEYRRRIADLLISADLKDAGLAFLRQWSYPIQQYWVRIPEALDRQSIRAMFDAFRQMASDFGVVPWDESSTAQHKTLLSMILNRRDDEAIHFIANEIAANTQLANQ